VGQGVLALLGEGNATISARSAAHLVVTHIGTRTPRPEVDIGDARDSRDVFAVARDPEVDVLIELIGGTTVAKELVIEALQQKKHVITANKALLADHGGELFLLAEQQGVSLKYEAAVAGGIPIIETVRASLAANEVTSVAGIINGTGNFILTAMASEGRAFDDVLQEAQRLGYAEADPTFDVDGTDAAQKLVLLASLAFGAAIPADAPFKQGVDSVAPEDLEFAKELGYRIKHLGIAQRDAETIQLRVHPTLIPEGKAIAQVDGVLNAVMINGTGVGELLLVGPGAGSRPTASAVCGDLVSIAGSLARNESPATPSMGVPIADLDSASITHIDDVSTGWYLRLDAEDKPGVMASITKCLSEKGIGIESLIQKPEASASADVPVIIVTDRAATRCLNDAVSTIEAMSSVVGRVTCLRVENFD
jgi:homoserine dehydrogenase